ncbi:hypothetical protein BWL13_02351 [Microbacterium oleivorans]|uniref:Uncharacterized protein n=1 Tax=Microbacterium oleivorans TaxID=273677 RepID=A0A031FPW4_9MICO|nr:hypothetical protein BWL13_02351 [Microbacterium oleivorans]EZP26201.1 hypothetical protein BW34_02533 [Microbacterium oleivorans]
MPDAVTSHPGLNAAVIAFLGSGNSSFPRADEEAIIASPVDRAGLVATVRDLVDECLGTVVDWSTHTLAEGGRAARAAMAQRHPELSPAALDALAWAYTYNWR